MPIWECKLNEFEGPLDLLLTLINREKIKINDIFISEITEQYLQYMTQIKNLDMERASEFLNIAALLLYIKSKSLLPNNIVEDYNSEYINPEEQLKERLREYKKYKEAANYLQSLAVNAAQIYFKKPEEFLDFKSELNIIGADTMLLYELFNSLKNHNDIIINNKNNYVKITKDIDDIRIQKQQLLKFIIKNTQIEFFNFFDIFTTKQRIAVTFFAMLELWHEGKIRVSQYKPYAPIILSYNNLPCVVKKNKNEKE